MLGSPILYLKGMRIMMFQLSGFYCKSSFKGPLGGIPGRIPARVFFGFGKGNFQSFRGVEEVTTWWVSKGF